MPQQLFQEYLVGVIEEGQATFTYKGENTHIGAGSLLLIQPGEPFSGQGSIDHPRRFRMLHAKPQFVQRLLSEITEKEATFPAFNNPVERNRKLVATFSKIHRALELPHTQLERDSWLLELMQLLHQRCISSAASPSPFGKESDRIKQIKSFLLSNFADNTSLEELADFVNLSPYRLNRVFSQEVGVPPHAFVSQVRVWQAKEQLAKGVSPAQVAVEVGFYDQAHMNRHFKRLLGYTPGVIQNDKNVQ